MINFYCKSEPKSLDFFTSTMLTGLVVPIISQNFKRIDVNWWSKIVIGGVIFIAMLWIKVAAEYLGEYTVPIATFIPFVEQIIAYYFPGNRQNITELI